MRSHDWFDCVCCRSIYSGVHWQAAASAEAAALRARVQQLEAFPPRTTQAVHKLFISKDCLSAALVQMSVQESTASASDGLEELRQKVNEAENEFSKHD